MKIFFTKKQYETLAKTVYLGNWMANAHRDGSKEDPLIKEYGEMSDYVFSLAPEFGFSENFEAELEYSDDDEEETEVNRLHEEYDEATFWDELPDRLGDRDFYDKYTEEDWNKMTRDERFLKNQECIIKWEKELAENGIERLGIVRIKV